MAIYTIPGPVFTGPTGKNAAVSSIAPATATGVAGASDMTALTNLINALKAYGIIG